MIAHIEGILESKTPTHVVIDVNGVGYMLNISLNTYDELPSKGKLRLFSHLIVREDAHILFGFSEQEERMMFRELINVSGVGASTALMVLSSMKPADVAQAVDQSDVNAFKSVKGIGLKSAQRIIVDLKGKLDKIESNNDFFPFSLLSDNSANTLIFPNLSAGNIAYKLVKEMGDREAIGPILLGMKKPVHVLQIGSSVREIFNMITLGVVDVQNRK